VKEGVFWDGPVRGLAYVSGEQTGFTDDEGRFKYEDGKTVIFKVGDIVIGEAPASPIMTPEDLVTDAQGYMDTTVANIIRFLETLDEDETPYNGIDIEADEGYDDENIDFTLPEASFETEAEALIDKVFEDQRDLVSLQSAMDHFRLALLMVPGSEIEQNIQKILDAVLEKKLPGVSLAVLALDGNKWNGTSGVADMETKEPLSPDHRIRIGSVTKTFTGMMVMQLVQEGVLELDDTVADWLPGNTLSEQYDAESITIRQLLNHTSGIYSFPSDFQWNIDYLLDLSITFTPQELVDIANNYDPTAAPGEVWSYTSTGAVLLGMIIELATGSTWEEEVRTRFIEELGLEDTSVPGTGEIDIPCKYAHGYFDLYEFSDGEVGEEGVLMDFTKREPSATWSSGNMIGTTQDVARWFMAIGEGELLNQEYQTTLMNDKFEIAGLPLEMGLSIVFNPDLGVIQHPGQIAGYDDSGFYHMESHAAFG
ncbi:MAG: beta-lactamase family protein, partial [Bacteroidetes bacterium]|nr:beta-lactamase family protein [Bacteroidota bacterium]